MESIIIIVIFLVWGFIKMMQGFGADVDSQHAYDMLNNKRNIKKINDEQLKIERKKQQEKFEALTKKRLKKTKI